MDDQNKPEMTRGTQTALICGAIGVALFIGIGVAKVGPDPKYPRCELGFMGTPDEECRGDESLRHLMSLPPAPTYEDADEAVQDAVDEAMAAIEAVE